MGNGKVVLCNFKEIMGMIWKYSPNYEKNLTKSWQKIWRNFDRNKEQNYLQLSWHSQNMGLENKNGGKGDRYRTLKRWVCKKISRRGKWQCSFMKF